MDDLKKLQKHYGNKGAHYGKAKPQTDHTEKYEEKQRRVLEQSRERHSRQQKKS